MIFTLKQYDFELLTFELRQEGLDGFACSILSVNEAKRHLLPHGMPLNVDGLLAWLKSRIIPRNREHVDNLEVHYFHLKRYRKKLDKKTEVGR